MFTEAIGLVKANRKMVIVAMVAVFIVAIIFGFKLVGDLIVLTGFVVILPAVCFLIVGGCRYVSGSNPFARPLEPGQEDKRLKWNWELFLGWVLLFWWVIVKIGFEMEEVAKRQEETLEFLLGLAVIAFVAWLFALIFGPPSRQC